MALWGLWLLVLGAFFSAGGYVNSYYVAALAPAIGALCGMGVATAWRRREEPAAQATLAGALLASVLYGIYLLHGGTAVPGWLVPAAVIAALAGTLASLVGSVAPLARHRLGGAEVPSGGALAIMLACALLLPGAASALIVIRGLGPFAAPYEPSSATVSRAQQRRTQTSDEQAVEQLTSTYTTPIPLATDSSILAAPFILATGREILPIGGFQGGIPAPTLATLKGYIAAGNVRAFLIPREDADPRMVWIRAHCTTTGESDSPTALYDCGNA